MGSESATASVIVFAAGLATVRGELRKLAGVDGAANPGAAAMLKSMEHVKPEGPTVPPQTDTASGVLKTLYYRPDLFGRPFSEALDLAMRGPSDWSTAEM